MEYNRYSSNPNTSEKTKKGEKETKSPMKQIENNQEDGRF